MPKTLDIRIDLSSNHIEITAPDGTLLEATTAKNLMDAMKLAFKKVADEYMLER